jgi:hypothetical protein
MLRSVAVLVVIVLVGLNVVLGQFGGMGGKKKEPKPQPQKGDLEYITCGVCERVAENPGGENQSQGVARSRGGDAGLNWSVEAGRSERARYGHRALLRQRSA